MGVDTKIEWTTYSWSPWHGCARVSPGCTNCYAEARSHRNPAVLGIWGVNGTRVVTAESGWDKPLEWDRKARRLGKRHRVFPSICDPFEDRPELRGPRLRLARLIRDTPNLDWLLLTKRPEDAARMIPEMWGPDAEFPGNCWLGTSVENADYRHRINILREIAVRTRFVSFEPLLGDVGELDLTGIHWAICGGESGPRARPCDLAWIRSIVRRCRDAGVAVFVKQLGARPVAGLAGSRVPVTHGKGGNPDEWLEDLRVREFPDTKCCRFHLA
jgi:protein gp37